MLKSASDRIPYRPDLKGPRSRSAKDADTLLRVLCHKRDNDASEFLKLQYQLPKSSGDFCSHPLWKLVPYHCCLNKRYHTISPCNIYHPASLLQFQLSLKTWSPFKNIFVFFIFVFLYSSCMRVINLTTEMTYSQSEWKKRILAICSNLNDDGDYL